MIFRHSATLALIILATPALADAVLPIGGAFGNDAGCDYFMTGVAEAEDLRILTPDTFTAGATGCHFDALVGKPADGFELAASCKATDGPTTHETLLVTGDKVHGYYVRRVDTPEWGPLLPCPGTEAAFRPLGTQV